VAVPFEVQWRFAGISSGATAPFEPQWRFTGVGRDDGGGSMRGRRSWGRG
jgi:hypothetical protein